MNYVPLILASLMVCSLHSALGIMCKKCTPDVQTFKTCTQPEQLVEVDCDNETFPFNVTEGTKYDSCATTTIGATIGGQLTTSFVMSCAVKVNSSNPSVVNCSLIQDYVCGDARRRAGESGGVYSIDTCSSVCCTEKSCNVHPTSAPPDNKADGNTSTAASTTVNGNGVSEVQPPCFGLLLVMLAISVAMKKVDE